MTGMYRVRATSTGWSGAPGLNTFYFLRDPVDESWTADRALNCVERVRAGFAAANNIYPNTWSVQVQPEVDVIEDTTGALTQSFITTGVAPLAGLSPLGYGPLPAMMLLRLRTETIHDGSRIVGRAFLGPLGKGNDTNGSPDVGAVPLAQAMGDALLSAGINANPKLAVWRRPREAKVGPPVVNARLGTSAYVSAIVVPDKFAVLRSRRD